MARKGADLGARLRRVLVMIPWLLAEEESTVAAIADRFGVDEDEVVRDLNLVMCCGRPPYGGDDMITVVLDDDGSVTAWPGPFFTRPMQLTPTEGFAVLAAGRTLEKVHGAAAPALASALDKLEAALGTPGTLAVDLEQPPLLDVVRRAAAGGERLRVTYYSAWRDETSERLIEPVLVHSKDGRWYAESRDVSEPGSPRDRRLRIDRIQRAEPTGERFDPPSPAPAPPERLYSGGDGDATEVTLVVPSGAGWVADAFELDDVEELDGGRLRVRLHTPGGRLFERLLLRLGAAAVIESPPAMEGLRRAAAERVLQRYRDQR